MVASRAPSSLDSATPSGSTGRGMMRRRAREDDNSDVMRVRMIVML